MRINSDVVGAELDLHTHLFDKERLMPPPPMRADLVQIQNGKCILTGEDIEANGNSLDHVIPWSRAHLSEVENFLITTKSVNSAKSDSLPALPLVERWLEHIEANAAKLQECAARHHWDTNFDSVRRVARQTYRALPPSIGVWAGKSGIRALAEQEQREIVALLS